MKSCKFILIALLLSTGCKKSEPVIADRIVTDVTRPGNFAVAGSNVYYVDNTNGKDSNNGTTPATAWKTIGKVNALTYRPGDKILFKAGGSWTKQLHPLGSGTNGNPIIIGRYGTGPKPRLNGAGVANGTIYLFNQQYWEINDLEITNYNPADVGGITLEQWENSNNINYANAVQPPQLANQASLKTGVFILAKDIGTVNHIFLRGLNVHGVNGYIRQSDENSKYNGGVCFRINGTANPTWFNDILVDSCVIHDVDRTGLWTESTWSDRTLTASVNWKPSTNITIRNNTFFNTGANALIVRVADRPLMEHNVFDHCAIKASGNAAFNFNTDNAIWQYNESRFTKANADDDDAGGIDADYKTRNTVIQYNYIHDNDYGMLITGGPGVFNDNTVVRYNIFKKDGKFAHPVDGKFMIKLSGKANRTFIYNNVIDIGPSQTNTHMIRFHNWSGWPSATTFYNNIFDNSGVGTLYYFGGSTGNVFDYNLFYKYQVSGQPIQSHPVNGEVKFVNAGADDPSGFKLKSGSVALAAGVSVTENGGLDYFGLPVSAVTAPNVGAYNGTGL